MNQGLVMAVQISGWLEQNSSDKLAHVNKQLSEFGASERVPDIMTQEQC